MKSKITIKQIQDLLIKGVQTIHVDDDTSRRMWWASLEVIQKEFLSQNYQKGGIWVASPLPALNDKKFSNKLHGWLWSPGGFPYFQKKNAGFLPVNHSAKIKNDLEFIRNYKVFNLSQEDGYDPFFMVITTDFQCILSITGEKDKKILLMKCDEESLKISIELMHAKLNQENYEEGVKFRDAINNLGNLTINNKFDPYHPDASSSNAPHRIFNIGNGKPINLLYFINLLEKEFGIEALKDYQPIQPGDVQATFSSTNKLKEWIGYNPETSIEEGVKKFVNWYKDFYGSYKN